MFEIRDNDLYVTKGDTIIFDFIPTYKDGTPYEVHKGDHFVLGVKEANSEKPVILYDIPMDTFEVRLDHQMTDNLDPKRYVYDISLFTQSEFVDTFHSGYLYILKEVTRWVDYETLNHN